MESSSTFAVDEVFPRLPNPPITEAVLEVRGVPELNHSEVVLKDFAATLLPDYSFFGSLNEFQFQFNVTDGAPLPPAVSSPAWVGIRLQSVDSRFVVQWKQNGFVFSQVAEYSAWDDFFREFTKVFNLVSSCVHGFRVERLGLRYINRLDNGKYLKSKFPYLADSPVRSPSGLQLNLKNFLHQENFEFPGSTHGLNRTIAVQGVQSNEEFAIVDLDAFWQGDIQAKTATDIETQLRVLRWIKNRFFFSTIDEGVWK